MTATRRGRARRRRSAALAAALVALLIGVVGCTSIPSSSGATVVNKVAQSQDSTAAGLLPVAGQQPDQIVRGFIAASGRPDLDSGAGTVYSSAKQYLDPTAQKGWQATATQVVILSDGYRTATGPQVGTVIVSGTQVGYLDIDRSYHPRPGKAYSRTFHLRKVENQWRIVDPPTELTMVAADFSSAFRVRPLYFLDATQTVVVPDLRYVPLAIKPDAIAARLMALLLRGPSSTLVGAARSELSGKAQLVANVATNKDGVLQVDLTGVDVSTATARRALAAQIAWTVSQDAPEVAITVDGDPLDPAAPISRVSSFTSFDPNAVAGTGAVAVSDPFYVSPAGAVLDLATGAPMAGAAGSGELVVQSAAESAASGAVALVVRSGTQGQSELRVGLPTSGRRTLPNALSAGELTTPSFTRSGGEVWVVQNGGSAKPEVYRIGALGAATRLQVLAPTLQGKGEVLQLALSPDGVRVAVIAGRKLLIGTIGTSADATPGATQTTAATTPNTTGGTQYTLDNLTELRSDITDVGAVAFSSASELLVAAHNPASSYRTLWRLSIDGYDLRSVSTNGIFGDVDSVAVSGSHPLYITYSGRIWELNGSLTDGRWASPDPQQPSFDGAFPFYPN